jgi:hypothetical protein
MKVLRRKRIPTLSVALTKTLEEGILAFSDLQAITSLSLLIAGFTQLRCSISAYDWQILVYTAWFASLTHMTTLTALRHFFQRYQKTVFVIRVVLMLAVLLLLVVALLPTCNPLWFYGIGFPAVCYFDELGSTEIVSQIKRDPRGIVSGSLSISILAVSYTSRVVQIYPYLDGWTRRLLRELPGQLLKMVIRKTESKWLMPLHFVSAAQLVLGRAIYDLLSSLFWEVSVSLGFLI